MKSPDLSDPDKSARVNVRFLLILGMLSLSVLAVFAASPVPANKPTAYPAWWIERDVIPRLDPANAAPTWSTNATLCSYAVPNDFAAINQGQLKNLAARAYEELNAKLPGGAGGNLTTIYATFLNAPNTTGNYNAINLGQLKNLAQPFYDRLIQAAYASSYPWTPPVSPAKDYAMANIGQAKNLFSFDLSAPAGQLPIWWQKFYFGTIGQDPNALAPSNSGLTLLQTYLQGLNPNDFYNGKIPSESAPPAAPSNLRATRISDTQVKYEWDDNSNNERGFKLQRYDGNGNWVVIATVGPNQTSIVVTNTP